MFELIKKIFIGLLTGLVIGSNNKKCVSLGNQKFTIQPTLINLHPNEYSQEFHHYTFAVKLDRCVGSCNTLNDLCNEVFSPNKTEDLNLSVLNVITGINESETLTKHISCKCKCRCNSKCNVNVNVIQINGGITINVYVNVKKFMYVKKIMFGILLHVIVKMEDIYQVLWMIQRLCAMKL